MTDRWTTEDIARELSLASPAAARSLIRRWRARGVRLDVEIDELTGVKRYLPDQIRTARERDPGRGTRTDLRKRGTVSTTITTSVRNNSGAWEVISRDPGGSLDGAVVSARDIGGEVGQPLLLQLLGVDDVVLESAEIEAS